MAPRSIRPHASRHCLPLHLHELWPRRGPSRDTRAGTAIWSDRFEGQAEDLFELQDESCPRCSNHRAPGAALGAQARSCASALESLDAAECVVRGMDLLYHFEAGRQEEALPFFLRALALDSSYATAYALPRPATLSGSTRVA